jgi:hypothetical protein
MTRERHHCSAYRAESGVPEVGIQLVRCDEPATRSVVVGLGFDGGEKVWLCAGHASTFRMASFTDAYTESNRYVS